MPKICYQATKFRNDSLVVIKQANEIIAEYVRQGYELTLRQLYYQFVARDLLKNTNENYKRLGSIINDGRMAGMIDWDCLVDRTRGIESLGTWDSPSDIVSACADSFRYDLWAEQEYRPEVWIEKEALAGVFERVCNELRVPYLSCRGYTSQSEMWRAGRRLRRYAQDGKRPIIFHFGDHDPSGLDMSRDIKDRLRIFMEDYGDELEFRRLALNMVQVEEYEPPPNPAKTTDARFSEYESVYGDESWELDALDPAMLSNLVRDAVTKVRDDSVWEESLTREEEARRLLGIVAERWDKITRRL